MMAEKPRETSLRGREEAAEWPTAWGLGLSEVSYVCVDTFILSKSSILNTKRQRECF